MALLTAPSIEAVKDSIYVQVTVAVFVVCICTRILSSHRFKQIKYGKAQGIEPPTLPYWIPFLKHAFSMAWDMRRFSARSLNKYDDETPFFLDAAGTRMLLVTDPAHIKRMMSASKEADPNPFIHEMILGQMLGSPKDNVDYYRKNDHMHHVQTNQIRQHITGAPLVAMSRIVFQQLKHKVEQDCKSVGDSEWIDIPDLFLYLQNHVTIAIAEALLGSKITEFYPEMTSDLWAFMDGSNEIVMGLPRFAIPKAFAARDRLLANLKRWARMSDELRISGKADPVWDSRAGSGLLQQRQELYQKTPTFDEDACVAQVLGLLFGGNSITPTITFWYVFHALRDQKLAQEVISNLREHVDTNAQAYDFMQLTTAPILRSSHAETTRLYASNLAVRVITSPTFALDDKYVVTKGTQLLIHNKFTGLYTKGWTNTRPSTTQRPLEEFWPERFLIPGDGKPRFSDVGLQGNWTSYGGGEHKCPGRFFALNIGVVALAVMFGEFECELVDQEAFGNVMPELRETAFGKAEPTIKIRARLRRRVRSSVETP